MNNQYRNVTNRPMYNISSAVTCRTLAIVRSLPLPGCDFGLLKIQVKFLINWSLESFVASGLSTYDFSTLYTTLPYYIIKENSQN